MAYTSLSRPAQRNRPLSGQVFLIAPKAATDDRFAILTLPFDFPAGDQLDPILEGQLQEQFNAEIETGLTYPYEGTMNVEGFKAYFCAFDLVLGLLLSSAQAQALGISMSDAGDDGSLSPVTLPAEQLTRIGLGECRISAIGNLSRTPSDGLDLSEWSKTYAFSYYIKPNYPGRSSHLCNAGFIVSAQARGKGLGSIAGRSYLYYGPGCGYLGSVFNLVYTTNLASARIWQRLGFQIVGTLPKAGRLKKKDGGGEEFVDAAIVYGDFEKIGLPS